MIMILMMILCIWYEGLRVRIKRVVDHIRYLFNLHTVLSSSYLSSHFFSLQFYLNVCDYFYFYLSVNTLTSISFCLLSYVRAFVCAGDATVPQRKGCIRTARTCRCGQTQSCHPSSTEGTYIRMYVHTRPFL